MRTVHVIVPEGIDDPRQPSGGNVYDRRMCAGLPDTGWRVDEQAVGGAWPWPDAAAERALAQSLHRVPDDAVVLVDGLIASSAPSVLIPAARRLRLVVLVHLPLGHQPPGHQVRGAREREGVVLGAARATVATSEWSRALLLRTHPLEPGRVHVAEPGADAGPVAPGTPDGGQLLCVAAVTWHKGHDLLLTALSGLTDSAWRCVCVGSVSREPAFVADLHGRADAAGLRDRLVFTGALVGGELDSAYAGADVLVLPSRGETHGMVVGEALARGLPVIAAAVGGVPDAVGRARDGRRPGLLVPECDASALAAAIERWLSEPLLRAQLRDAAALQRTELPGWSTTARRIADVLARVAA